MWRGLQLKKEEGLGRSRPGASTWAWREWGRDPGVSSGRAPGGDGAPPTSTAQDGAMIAERQAVGVLTLGGSTPVEWGDSGISQGFDPDQCHTQLRGNLTAADGKGPPLTVTRRSPG